MGGIAGRLRLVRVRSWRRRSDPTEPCSPTVRSTGATTASVSTSSPTSTRRDSSRSSTPAPICSRSRPSRRRSRSRRCSPRSIDSATRCRPGAASPCATGDTSPTARRSTKRSRSPRARRSVVAVGVNCSPPEAAIEAVAHLAAASPLAVVAYPNRGADWDADAKAWTGGDDVDMAAVARGLLDAGAHLVGGCCGTGPDDVRAIAIDAAARRESRDEVVTVTTPLDAHHHDHRADRPAPHAVAPAAGHGRPDDACRRARGLARDPHPRRPGDPAPHRRGRPAGRGSVGSRRRSRARRRARMGRPAR